MSDSPSIRPDHVFTGSIEQAQQTDKPAEQTAIQKTPDIKTATTQQAAKPETPKASAKEVALKVAGHTLRGFGAVAGLAILPVALTGFLTGGLIGLGVGKGIEAGIRAYTGTKIKADAGEIGATVGASIGSLLTFGMFKLGTYLLQEAKELKTDRKLPSANAEKANQLEKAQDQLEKLTAFNKVMDDIEALKSTSEDEKAPKDPAFQEREEITEDVAARNVLASQHRNLEEEIGYLESKIKKQESQLDTNNFTHQLEQTKVIEDLKKQLDGFKDKKASIEEKLPDLKPKEEVKVPLSATELKALEKKLEDAKALLDKATDTKYPGNHAQKLDSAKALLHNAEKHINTENEAINVNNDHTNTITNRYTGDGGKFQELLGAYMLTPKNKQEAFIAKLKDTDVITTDLGHITMDTIKSDLRSIVLNFTYNNASRERIKDFSKVKNESEAEVKEWSDKLQVLKDNVASLEAQINDK